MAPKLYVIDLSPPVRAVMLCGKALGIELEYITLNLRAGDQLKPEFLKLNPQHTVPTLVDDDGTAIWESHAIMAYLVGKYGKNDSLYPKDLKKRAVVDQRLHFDTGNVFAIISRTVRGLMHKKHDTVPEECIELANLSYDFLNTFLGKNAWVTGDTITIADFSLIASITSMRHLVPIDPKYANVLSWLKRAEGLPYYSVNKGEADFKVFVGSMIKK